MVEDSFGLFLGAGEGADGYDYDLGRNAQLGFKDILNRFGGLFKINASLSLHGQEDDITVLFGVVGDVYFVFARNAVNRAEKLLDLAREHIYAVNLEHIVGAAFYNVEPRVRTSAGTFARDNPRQIVCAESEQRSALLNKGGDNDFAFLAVGYILTCFGVDNLDVEKIVPAVHTSLLTAIYADTRAVDFSKSVDIVKLDSELV